MSDPFNDDFFKNLEESDDEIDLSKVGNDEADKAIKSEDSPKDPIAIKTKTVKTKKISNSIDDTSEEKPMTAKKEDDSAMKEFWQAMDNMSGADYRFQVHRAEPKTMQGVKINGFLKTYEMPIQVPDIIEDVSNNYGGGRYNLKVVDGKGKYIRSKVFDIGGPPKIPVGGGTDNSSDNSNTNKGIAPATPPSTTTPLGTGSIQPNNTFGNGMGVQAPSFGSNDWTNNGLNFNHRRSLRPGFSRRFSSFESKKDSITQDDLDTIKDGIEEKLESKLDALADAITSNNNRGGGGHLDSFLNPDGIKALAPFVLQFLESRNNSQASISNQAVETNKHIVGLMQNMQDLVTAGDRTREEFLQRERAERENARREYLENQRLVEERFARQLKEVEENNKTMLLQFQQSLEKKNIADQQQNEKFRLEVEKMREEYRLREDEARKKEAEAREQRLEAERKWHEELRRRDEENRERYEKHKDEMRMKEIEMLNASKIKEIEILAKLKDVEMSRMESSYTNNQQAKEHQMNLEMAIAKLSADNDQKSLQTQAQLEIEKLRHASQLQLTQFQNEFKQLEKQGEESTVDRAIREALEKKVQIDLIKELGMSDDKEDGLGDGIKAAVGEAFKLFLPVILGMLRPQALPGQAPAQPQSRPQSNPRPRPQPSPAQEPSSEEEYEEYEDMPEEGEFNPHEDPATQLINLIQHDPAAFAEQVTTFLVFIKDNYKKESTETAAQFGAKTLSPLLIQVVSQIESEVLLQQLGPVISMQAGPEAAEFFNDPQVALWLDEVIEEMGNILINEKMNEAEESVEENSEEDK